MKPPKPYKRTRLQILLRKRADARASIKLRHKQIAALEARIASVEAEMATLTNDVAHVWHSLRIPFRANGEMQRAVFDLLRETGLPITAADVAARMIAHFGLAADDPAIGYAMRQRAIQALKRCERMALVRMVGRLGRYRAFTFYN